MDYKIMSREACERYARNRHKETSVVISIKTPRDEDADIPCEGSNGVKDVLRLEFADSDVNARAWDGFWDGMMTHDDGLKITEFAYKWYGRVDRFIFHCDAGVSRSAGVCAAVMRWFEGSDREVFDSPTRHPNMFCYLRTLDAFRGIRGKKLCSRDNSPGSIANHEGKG